MLYQWGNLTKLYADWTITLFPPRNDSSSNSSESSSSSSMIFTVYFPRFAKFPTGDGVPVVTPCGPNMQRNGNGACACKSGYYQSGRECKSETYLQLRRDYSTYFAFCRLLIIAIVVPVGVVLIFIIGGILLYKKLKYDRMDDSSYPNETGKVAELEAQHYSASNLVTDYSELKIQRSKYSLNTKAICLFLLYRTGAGRIRSSSIGQLAAYWYFDEFIIIAC